MFIVTVETQYGHTFIKGDSIVRDVNIRTITIANPVYGAKDARTKAIIWDEGSPTRTVEIPVERLYAMEN